MPATLDSVKKLLGDTVAIRYANFPLASHRFARSGAIAVECASEQRIAHEFVNAVYSGQDSIGFWPWDQYAIVAGSADPTGFNACLREPRIASKVDSTSRVARELGVKATPTTAIGNRVFEGALSAAHLVELIREEATQRRASR